MLTIAAMNELAINGVYMIM